MTNQWHLSLRDIFIFKFIYKLWHILYINNIKIDQLRHIWYIENIKIRIIKTVSSIYLSSLLADWYYPYLPSSNISPSHLTGIAFISKSLYKWFQLTGLSVITSRKGQRVLTCLHKPALPPWTNLLAYNTATPKYQMWYFQVEKGIYNHYKSSYVKLLFIYKLSLLCYKICHHFGNVM